MTKPFLSNARCALAIAHPGHEIRVLGWLAEHRPLTSILTDGSGRSGAPRLHSSARLLSDLGVCTGSLFGRFSDRQIYEQVLARNADPFLRLADELARQWVQAEIDVVLGDACEGTIMTHDLWRGVIDRAIQLASQQRGVVIRNLAFSLEDDPQLRPIGATERAYRLELDEQAWKYKISAAENYAGLRHEVDAAFARWGKTAFRYETIWDQSRPTNWIDWSDMPTYERHGEDQVRAGVYRDVVRYRDHVRPILTALSLETRAEDRAA